MSWIRGNRNLTFLNTIPIQCTVKAPVSCRWVCRQWVNACQPLCPVAAAEAGLLRAVPCRKGCRRGQLDSAQGPSHGWALEVPWSLCARLHISASVIEQLQISVSYVQVWGLPCAGSVWYVGSRCCSAGCRCKWALNAQLPVDVEKHWWKRGWRRPKQGNVKSIACRRELLWLLCRWTARVRRRGMSLGSPLRIRAASAGQSPSFSWHGGADRDEVGSALLPAACYFQG